MMNRIWIIIIACLLIKSSDGYVHGQQKNSKEAVKRELIEHYWDQFDLKKASLIPLTEDTSVIIVNYLKMLNQLPMEQSVPLVQNMIHKAVQDSTVFSRFIEIYESYLNDRYSPVYNEKLLKAVLQQALKEPVYSEIDRIRPSFLLDLISRNSEGEQATDFECTFMDGHSMRMKQIKAEYLLLFFYDPDCDHCKKIFSMLSNSSLIKEYLKNGRLKILAVYPDEDVQSWKTYSSTFPSTWMNVYNKSLAIRDEELYDLKDTPTLYLLDSAKNVVGKNILPENVQTVLQKELGNNKN